MPKRVSTTATEKSLFTNLHNNLISIGQLCDDQCKVNFNSKQMVISKNSKPILLGNRSTDGDGLWNINFATPSSLQPSAHSKDIHHHSSNPSLNVIIQKSTTAKDLILYFHAACFSPVKSTFLKAVQNNPPQH